MKEVYEKLHKDNETLINEKRRARDYQAACFEKDKALKAALEWIEGDDAGMSQYPEEWEEVYDKVKKALEA